MRPDHSRRASSLSHFRLWPAVVAPALLLRSRAERHDVSQGIEGFPKGTLSRLSWGPSTERPVPSLALDLGSCAQDVQVGRIAEAAIATAAAGFY